MEEPEVLDEAEAARYMRLSPDTLSMWRKRHRGPIFVRAGRRVVYLKSDLREWLQGRRVDPTDKESAPDAI